MEERLYTAVFEAAMQTEALYTVILGSPVFTRFSFVFPEGLQKELKLATFASAEEYLYQMLRLRIQPFFPTPRSTSDRPTILFGVDRQSSRFFDRIPPPKEMNVWCLNYEEVTRQNYEPFPKDGPPFQEWERVAHVCHNIGSVASLNLSSPDWMTEVAKRRPAKYGDDFGLPFWERTRFDLVSLCPLFSEQPLFVASKNRDKDTIMISTPTPGGGIARTACYKTANQTQFSECEIEWIRNRAAVLQVFSVISQRGNTRVEIFRWCQDGNTFSFAIAVERARAVFDRVYPQDSSLHNSLLKVMSPDQKDKLEMLLWKRMCTIESEKQKELDEEIQRCWYLALAKKDASVLGVPAALAFQEAAGKQPALNINDWHWPAVVEVLQSPYERDNLIRIMSIPFNEEDDDWAGQTQYCVFRDEMNCAEKRKLPLSSVLITLFREENRHSLQCDPLRTRFLEEWARDPFFQCF